MDLNAALLKDVYATLPSSLDHFRSHPVAKVRYQYYWKTTQRAAVLALRLDV